MPDYSLELPDFVIPEAPEYNLDFDDNLSDD